MFQQFAIQWVIRNLPAILCQFFGFCIDHEDCPDGVCDELMKECDEFGNCTPEPSATKPQAFDFNPDWSEFAGLVSAAREFVAALQRFLGLTSKVG